MLANVLRRLDESTNPNARVYAEEKPNSTARSFKIMTAEQAWQMTEQNEGQSHLYEVLSGACNLYLDIEWIEAAAPAGEYDKVKGIVAHVLSVLHDTYGDDPSSVKVSLASASGRVKNKYKCSWHVHLASTTVCWANAAAVGQFVRLACKGIQEVDKVPYSAKGQNWRCVGSSKATDPARKFAPANYETFIDCTVQQPIAGRQLIYPVVDVPTALDVPVPAYVQLLANSLYTGNPPMMCGPTRCVVPFRELQFCEHVGRKHHSNHQYAVINTETMMWKMDCHSCVDRISAWRTFASALVVQCFQLQTESYVSNAPEPPTLCGTESGSGKVVLDLATHGPPPARPGLIVHCADGMYHTSCT